MAAKITIDLTSGTDTAVLTLIDKISPINDWTCTPGFLSRNSGKWALGLASQPVVLSDEDDKFHVLQILSLNTFAPKVGASGGDGLVGGDGGTVADGQTLSWSITKIE